MTEKKIILIILDGWGHGKKDEGDCVYNAKTPFIDSLYDKYPNSELLTFGEYVGLPKGQMGNSEVGHLNIGSGRIVFQDLMKINNACNDGSLEKNNNLQKTFHYAKSNNKTLHLIGLLSDGGIHSHQKHLYKICELAQKKGVNQVFIHVFTDGRDSDPTNGKKYLQELEKNSFGAKIASVCGRYFAMDRDNRWERIKLVYNLMVKGEGEKSLDLVKSMQDSYDKGVTDEFVRPIVQINKKGEPLTVIKNQDAVICFNFRTDRCREITTALTQKDLLEFDMQSLKLHYTTMTNYDKSFKNINVIFNKENLKNTLGEVLEKNNLTQIRIAETEKYPHVTYFFSGGREKEFEGEKRIMINSPKVATYDLKPEMSALEITSTIIEEINSSVADFICLNFANPDMVGHTGVYKSIISALEVVDSCTKQITEKAIEKQYGVFIIADHGNADFTINIDGTPNTAHTLNPVPCFLINTRYTHIKNGNLADIAPTILKIMGVKKPEEMTGKTLI